jgi:hypothetical protein
MPIHVRVMLTSTCQLLHCADVKLLLIQNIEKRRRMKKDYSRFHTNLKDSARNWNRKEVLSRYTGNENKI